MTYPLSTHSSLALPAELAEAMLAASTALASAAFKAPVRPGRKRVGETLRPGPNTPLWNAVVAQLRPMLKDRGAKARLARMLGVPRQTVTMWVSARTRMPDAERTLQLIAWIIAQRESKPTS